MILRRYVARCLLPEARERFVVERSVIGLLSKRKEARSRLIIAGRFLTTRTNDTAVAKGGAAAAPGAGGGSPAASSSPQYVLPPPAWSLADLKLVQRASDSDENVDDYDGTAGAVLSREEVNKLCALAHIEVAPESDSAAATAATATAATGLDVAAVQRDVGAMLRCMQTMRRGHDEGEGRPLEHLGRDAEAAAAAAAAGGGEGAAELELPEEEDELGGPWGGAATWAAPMQEDVVSDGAIQAQILGSAKRTEAGFFTAPRVVGGEEEAL